jgi:hypothetical protein
MMTIEKKYRKIFWALIAIFLISYIAMVICIIQIKRFEKHGERFDREAMVAKFLKNDIGFSAQQLLQYDSLSMGHQQKVKGFRDSIRSYKNMEFKLLSAAGFNDSAIIIAAEKSAEAQRSMELDQLYYIKSIRQLCTPAQINVFDTSYVKIFSRRGEGKRRNSK